MLFRIVGALGPIPDTTGREAGYTLNRSPVYPRDNTNTIINETNKYTHSACLSYQFRITSLPNMHVFRLGRKSQNRGGTHTCKGRTKKGKPIKTKTSHRKALVSNKKYSHTTLQPISYI